MKFKKHDPRKYKRLICSVAWDEKSIQKSGDGALTVVGYANTKGKDRVGDVVLPEAFTKTLPMYMENPILLYMHDWDKVAGKVIHAEIDEKGLKVKARISGAKDCEDVRTKINEGILSTFSIGYNEIEADWEKDTATNVVSEVELLEISIVSIPCNTEAKFEPVDESKNEDETPAPKSAPNEAQFEDGNVFLVDDSLRDYFIEKINNAQNENKTVTKSLMKEWEMEICSEKKITPIVQKTAENQILTLLKDDTMDLKKLEALIKQLRGEKPATKDGEVETPAAEVKPVETPAEEIPAEETPAEEEKMDGDESEDQMANIQQQLSMLSEGLASVLEMLSMMGAEGDKMDTEESEEEDEEETPEEEEEEKMEDEEDEEDEESKDLEDLSDDEGIELLSELSDDLES